MAIAFAIESTIDELAALARKSAIDIRLEILGDAVDVPRNREAPEAIEVVVLPSTMRPTGIGEIGIPPIAPAIANAIAALTGTRVREMPFIRAGFDLTANRS